MIEMENIGFQEQDLGDFIPESLFEAIDQLNNEGKSCINTSVSNVSIDEFMDFDLDLNSENCTMNSFLELEKEIEEVPFFPDSVVRPSVIVKPRPKPATVQPSLTDIMSSCGIEYDLPEDCNASSPSSPTESVSNTIQDNSDSDPEWTPSPAPLSPSQLSLLGTGSPQQARPRKKYARSKPPSPPSVCPYPMDKKERKKAQNRTAAFRYREKKKSEQDLADEELEALEDKNIRLKEKLSEMETEFKYLKKLMVEAGLGKYTLAVNY